MTKFKGERVTSLKEIIYLPINISYLRKLSGKSLKDFGKVFDCSHSGISRWENGERFPDLLDLVKIHEITGYSLDELVLTEISKGVDFSTPKAELIAPVTNKDLLNSQTLDFTDEEYMDLLNYVNYIKSKRK